MIILSLLSIATSFFKLQNFNQEFNKMVLVDRFLFHLGPDFGLFGGRWLYLTSGRCSEVNLVLKLLGRVLEWSLLTGGRYLEVVVNTGLTVFKNTKCGFPLQNNGFDSDFQS